MAKGLAVFSCTWNGIPLIYSGQELPNHKRLKFFEKDEIIWRGENKLHNFYKTLLNLHSSSAALRAGDPDSKIQRIKTGDEQQIFSYLRTNGEHQVLVVLNFSNATVSLSIGEVNGKFREIFSDCEKDFSADKDFQMKGWEYLVFEK